jgi:hypothetical protein
MANSTKEINTGQSVLPDFPIRILIAQYPHSHNIFNLSVKEAKLLRDSLDLEIRKHE